MAFRFNTQHTLQDNIQRIFEELLDYSIHQLSHQAKQSQSTAVHESRKSFKKLRALFQLIRKNLEHKESKKKVRAHYELIRDCGRDLSGLRDAEVMLKTAAKVIRQADDEQQEPLALITVFLQDNLDKLAEKLAAEDNDLDNVINKLTNLQETVRHFPEVKNHFKSIKKGLQQNYIDGRLTYEAYQDDYSVEHLHEWRKRTKELWYHCRLLSDFAPKKLQAYIKRLSVLTDLQGDMNDLEVLADFLNNPPAHSSSAILQQAEFVSAKDAMLKLIRQQVEVLYKRSLVQGNKIFSETSHRFIKRMENYYDSKGSS